MSQLNVTSSRTSLRGRQGQRGVTLIELLIVMIIIAILSVVIFVSMTASIEDAENANQRDFEANVEIALRQWVAAKAAKRLADANGEKFSSCEVPLYSAELEDFIEGIGASGGRVLSGGCWKLRELYQDGFCVNPLAEAGQGNQLTGTPCSEQADCPDTWMGCGSFTSVTLILEPSGNCHDTGLVPREKLCTWGCANNHVVVTCGEWTDASP